jgi:hypothetical protein
MPDDFSSKVTPGSGQDGRYTLDDIHSAVYGATTETTMSEAWDKVQEAARALKEALDKAAHTSPAEAASHTVDLTKHVLDTAHRNIDQACDWVKKQVS